MGKIEAWIAILGAVGALIVALTPLVMVLIQSIKKGKASAVEAVKNGDWIKIVEKLWVLVQLAEKLMNFTGPQRKDWVRSQIILFGDANGIELDLDKIDKEIDTIIRGTRVVNADGKYKI